MGIDSGSPCAGFLGEELDTLIQHCNTQFHITPQMVAHVVHKILLNEMGPGAALFADENGKSGDADAQEYTESFPLAMKLQTFMLPSIDEYLELFDQRFMFRQCRTATWVTTLVYLLRLTQVPGFRVTTENVHMCALGCVTAAVKWLIDASPHSAYFASAGGITLSHHKSVERVVLRLLNYRLFVHAEPFAVTLLYVLQMDPTQVVPLTTLTTTAMTASTTPTSSSSSSAALTNNDSVCISVDDSGATPETAEQQAPSRTCCCGLAIPHSLHSLFSVFLHDTTPEPTEKQAVQEMHKPVPW